MTELDLWNQALGRVGAFSIETDAEQGSATATAANPVVVTQTSHGYSSGDRLLLTGFTEQTELNGRIFRIAVLTVNTYQLVGENGVGRTAETTGGTTARLEGGEYVKKTALAWPNIRLEILRSHPWGSVSKFARLARLESAVTITGITQANPAVVTAAAHGYSTGDLVRISGVVDMIEVNGRYFDVTAIDANTYSIGIDSSSYAAYSSGGSSEKALTPLTPDFSYAARYDLPSDYVRMTSIYSTQHRSWIQAIDAPWERVGLEVYSDESPTFPVRYVYAVTDPEAFDGALRNLLVARLAYEMVEALTQSNTKGDRLERALDAARMSAIRSDVTEQSPIPVDPGTWLLDRIDGGSI